MSKCTNEKCEEEAVLQFDHCGKLTCYCELDWQKYKSIMNAMGAPIPITYPIGTKPNE